MNIPILSLEKTVLLSCGTEIQFHTIHFRLDAGVHGVPGVELTVPADVHL